MIYVNDLLSFHELLQVCQTVQQRWPRRLYAVSPFESVDSVIRVTDSVSYRERTRMGKRPDACSYD